MTTTTDLMTTAWFRSNYASGITWPAKIGVQFYTRTPSFTADTETAFSSVVTLADLNNKPEWVKSTATATTKINATTTGDLYLNKVTSVFGASGVDGLQVTTSAGVSVDVEVAGGWLFSYSGPVITEEVITAAVFYLADSSNHVLFATTKGFGASSVARAGTVFGQFSTNSGASAGKEHAIRYDGVSFYPGSIVLQLQDPSWESAHEYHIWLEPQRTNFIANPSFEPLYGSSSSNTFGWRVGHTGTGITSLSTASGGIIANSRVNCAHASITGSGHGKIVLESNMFPKVSPWLSLSFNASGTGATDGTAGNLQYGVVLYDMSYKPVAYMKSGIVNLSNGSATSGFQTFTGLIQIPDDIVEMQVRLEFDGSDIWLDDVLADPHEGQFTYFDGNSTDGLVYSSPTQNDFQWMGGATYQNKHFSVWYNNYFNTRSRLIGDYDVTENVYKDGLINEWVPTGIHVVAHWNAVTSLSPSNWAGDFFYPISDVNGTSVSVPLALLDFFGNTTT